MDHTSGNGDVRHTDNDHENGGNNRTELAELSGIDGKVVRGVDRRPRRLYYGAKRALDIMVVLALSPVVVPVVAVLGVLVKIDSRGPVFFGQVRFGARRVKHDGEWAWELRTFRFHKLRSMKAGADSESHRLYLEAYIAGDEEAMAALQPERVEGSYKMDNDPRLTRVGRWIREWSIDELPQLWNVFVGDMTLVGPRPAIPYEVARYQEADFRRMAGYAGITGWWQINGRSTVDFQQMVDLDRYYLDRQSLRLDLEVLCRTVPVVMSRQGAG